MAEPKNLVANISAFVEEFMSHYDGSHDFCHIKRVLGLAHQISAELASPSSTPSSSDSEASASGQTLDPLVITLSALLHE